MNILSAIFVALGLSMDNFAVTIATGCVHHNSVPKKTIVITSILFTIAHFIMFSLGWFGGVSVAKYIGHIDHWLAFGILAFIGIRMIKEANEEKDPSLKSLASFKTLFFLSIATSIDALLVGMGISLTEAPYSISIIALSVCVFLTSSCGFLLGSFLGRKFGKCVEIVGGIILCLIGAKLLLEGLGIL